MQRQALEGRLPMVPLLESALIQSSKAAKSPASFLAASPQRATALPLGAALIAAFDRVGYGCMILERKGRVRYINSVARRLLQQNIGEKGLQCEEDWLRQAAHRLLKSATPWLPRDIEAWVTIPCEGDRPLALYCVPLSATDGDDGEVAIILADFGSVPQPHPETLRRLFGLTPAEAKIAVQVGQGEKLANIAREHRVSVATVRSQLSSIFGKTQTSCQAELAMLLSRTAILP